VEFLSPNRENQRRSHNYPFWAPLVRSVGLAVRWVVFLDGAAGPGRSPSCAGISEPAGGALDTFVREFGPTHVVANRPMADALLERIRAAAPGAVVDTSGIDVPLAERMARFLGIEAPAAWGRASVVDLVDPDYACTAGDEGARSLKPFVKIETGPSCLFARPIARNPHYAGIALPPGVSASGCAFCERPDMGLRLYRSDPVDVILRHVRAVVRTCPPWRSSDIYQIEDGRLTRRLAPFLEALSCEPGIPRSRFMVQCRVDELLWQADRIEGALARFAASGHVFRLNFVGVENLSDVENERLNKHIRAAQVAEAWHRIRGWSARWPASFEFRGFGFILFTPWTTLEDVEINLRTAADIGFGREHDFLKTRLNLRPGVAVTELARRDGLIADAFDDPLMGGVDDPGRALSDDDVEIPWRFAHPEAGAFYSLILRVLSGGETRQPIGLLRDRVRRDGVHRAMLAFLATAREPPAVATLDDLVGRLAERHAAPAIAAPPVPAGAAPRCPPAAAEPLRPASTPCRQLADALSRRLAAVARHSESPFDSVRVEWNDAAPGWGEIRVTLDGRSGPLSVFLRESGGFASPIVRSGGIDACLGGRGPYRPDGLLAARIVADAMDRVLARSRNATEGVRLDRNARGKL
jgi:hypothetical protein